MKQLTSYDLKQILSSHYVFDHFDASIIDKILTHSQIKNFESNTEIIKEGSIINDEFYLLLKGSAIIIKDDKNKKHEGTVSFLKVGDIFGETVVFGGKERTSSVLTEEPCEILVIENKTIRQLIDKDNIITLLEKLHSFTLKYLSRVNLKALELINTQRNMGIFLVNIILFMCFFSILVPILQSIIKSIDATWITLSIITVGIIFLTIRLLVLKIPLSFIGISKVNLLPSIYEAVIISLIIIFAGIMLKYILIHYVSAFHGSELFNTSKERALKINGIHRSNFETIFIPTVYCMHSIFQEILARGSIQSTLKFFLSFKHRAAVSIILASFIFASLHSFFGIGAVCIVFFPGLFWGWLYNKQGNIFGAAISHALIGVSFVEIIGPF